MRRSRRCCWTARCSPTAAMLMIFAAAGASPSAAQTIPNDPQQTCTVSSSLFNGWFDSGTPSANGVVKPADSVNFSNSPNCDFYRWSIQMFFWLMSPAPPSYGGGKFIFDSPVFYDVSPPDANQKRIFIPHVPGKIRVFPLRVAKHGLHGLPTIMDKAGRLHEVEPAPVGPSGKPIILNRAGQKIEIERATIENGKPVFRDKVGKTIAGARLALRAPPAAFVRPQLNRPLVAHKFIINNFPIFLDPAGNIIDVEQGQADGSVLQAQNGSLVYFATMVNDVYAYFLTGIKDGAIPSPGGDQTKAQFPTKQTDLNAIIAFAQAHGKSSFVDADALAIEVKTSWVEASSLPNASSYATMEAIIPTYDTSNPNQWIPNGQKTALLALVGMHVVGSTKGHPEMVWATFEHFGNAPNATYSYNSTSGPKTVNQNTAGTWLFCCNPAGPFNVARMMAGAGDSIVPAAGQTMGPSAILRMKPWGAAQNASPNPIDAGPTGAASNTEIISINNSVSSMTPAGDLRSNYFFMGATWTINGFPPSSNFGNPGNNVIANGIAVGTNQMENSTLETFDQGTTSFDQFGSSCFSCHSGNTVGVSHIFFAPGQGPPTGLQPLF